MAEPVELERLANWKLRRCRRTRDFSCATFAAVNLLVAAEPGGGVLRVFAEKQSDEPAV